MSTIVSGSSGGTAVTTTTLASSLPTYVPGYLFGLTLSTAGSSATFGVAAGSAMNSTATANMVLASAYTKTTSAWAVGTGNGSLDTGAIANNTWYHAHLIQRPDTGVVDVLISLSATAPTMPTNYTLFRRIGSMKTNGSAQWTLFQQNGDNFYIAEISDYTAASTGVATLRTLSIPTGVVLRPMLSVWAQGGAANSSKAFVAPAANSALETTIVNADAGGTNIYQQNSFVGPPTNTSAQIYVRVSLLSGASNIVFYTGGWVDSRGRDA